MSRWFQRGVIAYTKSGRKNGEPNQWRCNFERSRRTVLFHSLRCHNVVTFLNEEQDGHFKGILYYSREKSKDVRHIGMRTEKERERARCSVDTLYFGLILLKADRISRFHSSRGQCACVPLSISLSPSTFLISSPPLLPNSFSRDARLTRLRERQSLSPRTRFFFYFLSFFNSFFHPQKTAHWNAVICPQFDHKWSPQRGIFTRWAEFLPRSLLLSIRLFLFSFSCVSMLFSWHSFRECTIYCGGFKRHAPWKM